jgi:hypothetical protein
VDDRYRRLVSINTRFFDIVHLHCAIIIFCPIDTGIDKDWNKVIYIAEIKNNLITYNSDHVGVI